MITIFESILPVFLLVLLGWALRRSPIIDDGLWAGLEQLGYFVLFPALLFITLYRADFSSLSLGHVGLIVLVAVTLMSLLLLAAWPAMRAAGVAPPAYTTVFQTASRWNAFIALAVAEKLAGADGLAVVALVMAVIIIPLNVINVSVLIWFGKGGRDAATFGRMLLTNPLILGCAAGIGMHYAPIVIYAPVEQTIELIARSALPLGLLMVGAGLQVREVLRPRAVAGLPVLLKLIVFPAIMTGVAIAFGADAQLVTLLALCAAVPTAMNGYLLARQLGGDAPLYATVTTLQTASSFLTIPLVLAVAARLVG